MDTSMTIGAFARRTGLSATALRFYDRRGLLAPAFVDPSTGYRRYTETQVETGTLIRDLRRVEVPLTEIEAALQATPAVRATIVATHLERLDAFHARVRDEARALRLLDESDTDMKPPTASTNEPSRTEPSPAPMARCAISAPELARGIEQVLPAVGTDPEAPHLMTVLLAADGGVLRLVATDRHRMALRDLVLDDDATFELVVPAATLTTWIEPLAELDVAELTADGSSVTVSWGNTSLAADALPVRFPDHRPLLEPTSPAAELVVDRAELLEALPDTDSGAVTLTPGTADLLIGSTSIPATVVGALDRVVALESRYLRDAAANAVGPELVVEINDERAPVVFRSADDGAYLSLVMPIIP